MEKGNAFTFDSPAGLEVSGSLEVLGGLDDETGELTPTRVIALNQDWLVRINLVIGGTLTATLTGSWQISVYGESVMADPDMEFRTVTIPVEHDGGTDGERIIDIAMSGGLVRKETVIKLVTVIAHHDQNGKPTRIAGFVEGPLLQFYREENTEYEVMISTSALSDKPSSDNDLFGYTVYAKALSNFIKDENTDKPLTISIDADWGMGKTTLMKMIQSELDEAGFPTAWFSAWKYDKEDMLWAALALEILSQVRERFKNQFFQRVGLWFRLNWNRFDFGQLVYDLAKAALRVVALLAVGAALYLLALTLASGQLNTPPLAALGQYLQIAGPLGIVSALFLTGKDAVKQIAGPFDLRISDYMREPDYQGRVGFIAQFEEDFKRVVKTVADRKKLIIFIDDLDRCAPPKSVEIIEAINLLTDARDCVFVIGMDSRAVAASIEAKYKALKASSFYQPTDASGLTLGERFLEKIIQIHFRIPRIEPKVMDYFIVANLVTLEAKHSLKSNDEVAQPGQAVTQLMEQIKRQQDNWQDGGNGHRPRAETGQAPDGSRVRTFIDSPEVMDAIREAMPYLSYNPRKIKRFINLYRLLAYIASGQKLLKSKKIELGLLSRWVILQNCWPDIVTLITTQPDFLANLLKAGQLKQNLAGTDPKTSEGIEMQQNLDALLLDTNIKRFAGAKDLLHILSEIESSHADLDAYRYLIQII